jgi:soluble lytic murein transglycosylase-like protein
MFLRITQGISARRITVFASAVFLLGAVSAYGPLILPDEDASLMSVVSSTRGKAKVQAGFRRHLAIQLGRFFSPAEVRRAQDILVTLCDKYGMNPWLVLAVIQIESRYDNWAVSPRGAMGLLQIMPDTGQWLARRAGMPWTGPTMLFDPLVNLRLGIEYLGYLKGRYGNDMKAILSAYNAGPGKFEKDRGAGRVGYRLDYYKSVKRALLSDMRRNHYGSL